MVANITFFFPVQWNVKIISTRYRYCFTFEKQMWQVKRITFLVPKEYRIRCLPVNIHLFPEPLFIATSSRSHLNKLENLSILISCVSMWIEKFHVVVFTLFIGRGTCAVAFIYNQFLVQWRYTTLIARGDNDLIFLRTLSTRYESFDA